MARTPIAYVEPTKAGTTFPAETTADVANGNSVLGNDGRVVVLCRNSNGASTARVVTITPTATVDGLVPAARTVSIPAGASKLLGPYEVANYGTTLLISGDNAELKFTPIHFPG